MIQDVGNIEFFELFETDPKTLCTACLSYWNVGIFYSTCGHFLQKETEANRNFVKIYDGLSFTSRVCHQEGKTSWPQKRQKEPGDKEYYLANQLKKEMPKESSKESMPCSYEITRSIFERLNIIELKKFVDDGMFLQMKITLIISQKKNTSITRTNGGFIQIRF